MSKIFYIADWHFGHSNILAYDNRPFTSVEDMNNALVSKWNGAVSKDDLVYVLGDMFWCKADVAVRVLNNLNGHKILIKGNHDRNNPEFLDKFDLVTDYLEIADNHQRIVLSHYPIPCFNGHFGGAYHFYGHVHNSFEYEMMEHDRMLMEELYLKQCNMVNVGAMMPWINYTPRTFFDIVTGYNAEKHSVRT